MIPQNILNKKWFNITFNILYFGGLIIAIDQGFIGWFMLISSVLLAVVFWKPLIKIMKLGSEIYTEFCINVSDKTIGKLKPKAWRDAQDEQNKNSKKNKLRK